MDNLTVGSDLYKRILHRCNALESGGTHTERKLHGILSARLTQAELAHAVHATQACVALNEQHTIAHLADAQDWCATREVGSLGPVEL